MCLYVLPYITESIKAATQDLKIEVKCDSHTRIKISQVRWLYILLLVLLFSLIYLSIQISSVIIVLFFIVLLIIVLLITVLTVVSHVRTR